MKEELKKLEENRKFTAYMILGVSGIGFVGAILCLVFLNKTLGWKAVAIVALILVMVVVLLRYLKTKQRKECREFLLKYVICNELLDLHYDAKRGMSVKTFNEAGFWRGEPKTSLFSKEYVSGRTEDMKVEIADIDFSLDPTKNKQIESHWTGCMIHMETDRQAFLSYLKEPGGEEPKYDAEITPIVRELGKYVGENLYVNAKENHLYILLKNRIFGFVPEIYRPWTEERLQNNPFKEVHYAISLGKVLIKKNVL